MEIDANNNLQDEFNDFHSSDEDSENENLQENSINNEELSHNINNNSIYNFKMSIIFLNCQIYYL